MCVTLRCEKECMDGFAPSLTPSLISSLTNALKAELDRTDLTKGADFDDEEQWEEREVYASFGEWEIALTFDVKMKLISEDGDYYTPSYSEVLITDIDWIDTRISNGDEEWDDDTEIPDFYKIEKVVAEFINFNLD
ncbi:MAG: hypothetical protein HDS62_09480 [Bacteroidales bacterium]|nr:hypothetical protein [Bacteroidales bacterium]